jgi:MoxR-like ATPase
VRRPDRKRPHSSPESDLVVPAPVTAPFGTQEVVDRSRLAAVSLDLLAARREVEKVIVGQRELLDRVLVAILAGGHLLIEGVPGLAKTRTVRAFAEVLGGSWQRIQFTPDLVPADLVGTRIWLPSESRFSREIGPVSANFVLADEINRAPAKVQSALLQAMEEHQVTIGRETVSLPEPFVVLATQNPLESEGTYPLPEAQTDRFMFRVGVTYPEPAEELEILRRQLVGTSDPVPVLDVPTLLEARRLTRAVYLPKDVAGAVVDLVVMTRRAGEHVPELDGMVDAGAGVRGSLALCAAAQGRALLHGRDEVARGDVADLAEDTLAHRINLSYRAPLEGVTQRRVVRLLLERSGLLG